MSILQDTIISILEENGHFDIADLIHGEDIRQDRNIELIASENYPSNAVKAALSSSFTAKYAEGYPGKRYYGGCVNADKIEDLCKSLWQTVFCTNYHVNVQPHSGSQANMAALSAVLHQGDTILSMDLASGGHLSHGSPANFSGKLYNIISYGVNPSGWLDYDDLEVKIRIYRPKLVLAGASAYPREINFKRIYDMLHAPWCGKEGYRPIYMVDMAHIAGLVAAKAHQSPFGYADIITTTTHKTLRGPRGGLIFCKPELARKIDSAVFPGTQGGPALNIIAAKAVAAEEATTDAFKEYIQDVVKNCSAMGDEFVKLGYDVITGGTDNHMLLLDLTKTGLTGAFVQDVLDDSNITVNKNCIPGETRSPQEASGIRIGTAAMTTLGKTEKDFRSYAKTIDKIIRFYMTTYEEKE